MITVYVFAVVILGLGHCQDYNAVKCAIQRQLDADQYRLERSDASISVTINYCSEGAVLVRLSWHVSGTYSAQDGSGGSNGGRIRFNPESNDPDNRGLQVCMMVH